MGKPGTITLPEDRFVDLLVNTGRSLKAGGFKTILFLGESGGNRTGMRTAGIRLNELFKGEARAFWIDDYYTKSHADQRRTSPRRSASPRTRSAATRTFWTHRVALRQRKHVRTKKLAPGGRI